MSKIKSILQQIIESKNQTNEDSTDVVLKLLDKADYFKNLIYRAKGTIDSSDKIDNIYLKDINNTLQDISALVKKLK